MSSSILNFALYEPPVGVGIRIHQAVKKQAGLCYNMRKVWLRKPDRKYLGGE